MLGKVDQADIGKVQIGQPARITVESFKDKAFEGKVTKISPMGKEKDNVTTFEVRVSIANPGGELKVNMSANAEIIREVKKGVLLVYVQEQSPACKYVLPELGQGNIPVRSAYNNGALLVTGSLPPFADIRSIPVGEGRYPGWDDEAEGRRVAFLGSDAKKQLFAGRPAVGETIRVGDFPYTVVGVMRHKEQDSSYDGRDISKVFVPFSGVLRDFPNKPPATPRLRTSSSGAGWSSWAAD